MEKFEPEYTLLDLKRSMRNEEDTVAILGSIGADPEISFRGRLVELGIGIETTGFILRLGLGLHHYKIILRQESMPNDHRQCRELANWILIILLRDLDFEKNNHLLGRGPFLAQRVYKPGKLPFL